MQTDKQHAIYSAKFAAIVLILSMVIIAGAFEIIDHYTTEYINYKLDQKYGGEKW